MNRVDRLLAMILHLQTHRVVTAEALAQRFELSVRTVYRDLAALAEAGVPLQAEAGVGYRLMRGYHLPPVNFTPAEAQALVMGGWLAQQSTEPELAAQMQMALMKVQAVLPRELQERVRRVESRLGSAGEIATPVQASLADLQTALAEQRVLTFRYQGVGKSNSAPRTAEPQALIFYLERWHLIAWCRERHDYRDFRTDRITELALSKERFEAREAFSVERYIATAMPAPGLTARLRFSAAVADRAQREWWMGWTEEERTDSAVTLRVKTLEWPHLANWLLSFGATVTVLEPPELRQRLVQTAQAAAEHHAQVS